MRFRFCPPFVRLLCFVVTWYEYRQSCTRTSLHEWVEERCIDEVEKVANQLWGNLCMQLTLWQQPPGLSEDLHQLLDLTRDGQPTLSQDESRICRHLQHRGSPEGVAVQKAWQDGVEDLMRQNGFSLGGREAQFERDSLVHVEPKMPDNSCGSIWGWKC